MEVKQKVLSHQVGSEDYLFLSKRIKPFTRHGINQRLKYWCQRSGIKAYSYHSIRHYYATYCLNQGFNLAEVQKFLGHSFNYVPSLVMFPFLDQI